MTHIYRQRTFLENMCKFMMVINHDAFYKQHEGLPLNIPHLIRG